MSVPVCGMWKKNSLKFDSIVSVRVTLNLTFPVKKNKLTSSMIRECRRRLQKNKFDSTHVTDISEYDYPSGVVDFGIDDFE